jgi:hypothetical protein
MKRFQAVGAAAIIGSSLAFGNMLYSPSTTAHSQEAAVKEQPRKAALARARETVAMLDNIFKQAIVMITDKYVHDDDDFAAGSAAVLLFKNVSESGDNKVRLIDATGNPYDSENVARDDFEKEGLQRLKAGASTYDTVEMRDGKLVLRTVTAVPVVMEKCVMCHAHYADVKAGAPIGAISYTIPIK